MAIGIVEATAAVLVLGGLGVVCFGVLRTWIAGTLAAVTLVPYSVWVGSTSGVSHVGVAAPAWNVMTYSIPLLGLLIYAAGIRGLGLPKLLLTVGLCYFSAMTLVVWAPTQLVWSGSEHVILGLIAAVGGAALAIRDTRDRGNQSWLRTTILGLLLVQTVFVSAQFLGYPLSPHSEVDYFLDEGRAIGTFNHPGVLGKYCMLYTVVLLPGTVEERGRTRGLAWLGLFLCVGLSGATMARANTVAIVLAIALWLVLQRRGYPGGNKLAVALVAMIFSVPALAAALARFEIDSGGEREHLLAVARPLVEQFALTGFGPNTYVEHVGAYDAVTAAGYPVHNSLLLALIESGILGAVLIFAPLLIAAWASLSRIRMPDWGGHHARAVFCFLPGIMLILWTGWGLSAGGVYIALCFFLGVAWGAMRAESITTDGSHGKSGKNAPLASARRAT